MFLHAFQNHGPNSNLGLRMFARTYRLIVSMQCKATQNQEHLLLVESVPESILAQYPLPFQLQQLHGIDVISFPDAVPRACGQAKTEAVSGWMGAYCGLQVLTWQMYMTETVRIFVTTGSEGSSIDFRVAVRASPYFVRASTLDCWY